MLLRLCTFLQIWSGNCLQVNFNFTRAYCIVLLANYEITIQKVKLGFTSFSYSHFDLFDELLQLTVQLLQTPCYFRVVDILRDIDFLTLFLVFCLTRRSSWWWSLEYCCRRTNNFLFFWSLEGKAINVCSLFVTDIVIVIITTAPSSELEFYSSNIIILYFWRIVYGICSHSGCCQKY